MGTRLRSWWQQIKQHRMWSAVIIVASVLVIALVVVVVLGYWLNWQWVGVSAGNSTITTITTATQQPPAKTLWDWLQLLAILAIPVVVGLGAAWYTVQQGIVSDRENTDNQRETALQAYIDKISELLLHEQLGESVSNPKVEGIARARTVTVLRMLDSVRRGSLISFLSQTSILPKCIQFELEAIDLSKTDLTQVNLSNLSLLLTNFTEATLFGVNLSETFLVAANFTGADLIGANLSRAHLTGATLTGATLAGANLTGAILSYADMSEDDLNEALLPFFTQRGLTMKGAVLSTFREHRTVLSGANLREANLKGAIGITIEELEKQAKSLKGATMPDGSIHP